MKPVLEYLPRHAKESFVVKFFEYSFYPTPWHYHPEYELVLVTESEGKRFIGDDICDFGPGNLAFIGPNLPHLYRNDERYHEASSRLKARSIVVHFLESSLGNDMLALPEADSLRKLFSRSVRGLDIQGETRETISARLFEILNLDGLDRWMKLLDILRILATTDEYEYISRHAIQGQHEKDNERLNKVIEHVMKSFQQQIRLDEIAHQVNMTPAAFSRYFKKRTRNTFSDFISQIRLGHAAKLLQDDQLSVAEICYACGFNNLSNFNRQFKALYKMSPMQFRKLY
jgi:AraC-like DNA-binding protein